MTAIAAPASFQLISTVNKDKYGGTCKHPTSLLKTFKDRFLVLQLWLKEHGFLLRQRRNPPSARDTETEGP